VSHCFYIKVLVKDDCLMSIFKLSTSQGKAWCLYAVLSYTCFKLGYLFKCFEISVCWCMEITHIRVWNTDICIVLGQCDKYLVLNVGLLGLLEVDFDEAGAVQLDADTLAHNLRREAEVFQDTLMYRRQCAAAMDKMQIFTLTRIPQIKRLKVSLAKNVMVMVLRILLR